MRIARICYAIVYLILLYLPIALIGLFSFNDSVYVSFPLKSFTFRWYELAANNPQLIDALINSLTIAIITSLSATAIGLLAALATTRHRFAGRQIISMLIFAPLALPIVVAGASLLSIFSFSGISLSIGTVIIGHVMICTPFAYGVLFSRLSGLNPDFEHASMDLGEGPVVTFFRVTFPLALPGVISSLLLTFTISFDEFILAFFLSSNSPTLPVFMWSQMRFPDRLPLVLALATMVLIVSASLIVISQMLRTTNSSIIKGS